MMPPLCDRVANDCARERGLTCFRRRRACPCVRPKVAAPAEDIYAATRGNAETGRKLLIAFAASSNIIGCSFLVMSAQLAFEVQPSILQGFLKVVFNFKRRL